MMNEVKLDGVIQADETFMPISFKGNHKHFNLPRLAKKRGMQTLDVVYQRN